MSEVSPICSVCGLHYLENYPPDVRYHKKVHDLHVNGPKIVLPDGLHLIVPKSPLPHRRATEQAALLFKHELRFDFSTYCAIDTEDFRQHRAIASTYVSQSRVVGFLVERDVQCAHQYRLGDEKLERTEAGNSLSEAGCRLGHQFSPRQSNWKETPRKFH